MALRRLDAANWRSEELEKPGGDIRALTPLFCPATDKPDEAAKWRAERAKHTAPVEKGPMPREKK